MNIQQMKYVIAVANNGSFREAARKTFASQPSLSASIKELETELGIMLFTRVDRGAYLTEEGQDFLNRVEEILVQFDTLESHYLAGEKEENFSIAARYYDFLGPLTAQLLEEFKDEIKRFRIMETTTVRVIEEVREQHSEVGIIYMNEHNQAGIRRYFQQGELSGRSIGKFKTHIFLRHGHPLTTHVEITKEELLSYPQVRFTQDRNNFPYFYEDLTKIPDQETVIYISDRGTSMNIVLETGVYVSGFGIVIGGIREHLQLVPLAEGELSESYIVYSAKRPLSEIAQRLIKELPRSLGQQN